VKLEKGKYLVSFIGGIRKRKRIRRTERWLPEAVGGGEGEMDEGFKRYKLPVIK